jgi:hypothetical protein
MRYTPGSATAPATCTTIVTGTTGSTAVAAVVGVDPLGDMLPSGPDDELGTARGKPSSTGGTGGRSNQ